MKKLASMPRRDESSGFPQVSSMPSIRKNRNHQTSNWSTHHQRSNGAENLRKISSTANPFGTLKKSYPPISVSTMRSCESDEEDEAQDQLTGLIYFITFLYLITTEENL